MSDFGLTDELLEMIREREGWSAAPYRDPVGLPTIGYGHRIPSMDWPAITQAEGERLLREDVRRSRDAALRLSPGLFNEPQGRLAAITDFCFNAGAGNYNTSTLRQAVNRGDWAEAGRQMRRWVYGTEPGGAKVKLEGLVVRRERTAGWLEAV